MIGRAARAGAAGIEPRREHGSALVESLVALVLIAVAGALVAVAAGSGLRAAARAAALTRTTALAARELATVSTTAATAASTDATLVVSGFVDPVTCSTVAARDGALVTLTVDVAAGQPSEHVALATRRLVPDGADP